LLFNTLMVEW